ncbi:uncharacterized protein LOC132561001 [Ylistrum balloti]|uniref:uncharacterized protein LOC132561001 n=1 Tax=Ylistrum balloti TaxID=509963 RepID=UPI002905ECFE|nr:uncharacterized protein LOC132561001 [Ylistrum balloti]
MNSIISTCIFVSLAIAAIQCQRWEPERTCPEFNSRYEGENLIVSLNDGCDMVVGTLDITGLSGLVAGVPNTGSGLFTPTRGFHIPTVTYRRPQNLFNTIRPGSSSQMCPPYTVRYLGPRVVVDTVPNTCQKVLGVRTFQTMISGGEGSQRRMGMRMVTRAVFENPGRLI